MEKEKLLGLFHEYVKTINIEEITRIWEIKSKEFQNFWNNKILSNTEHELNDDEIDKIIRIFDIKAKGNKKGDQAVANVMIPQGVWQRLFKEIKNDESLKNILTKILKAEEKEIVELIDSLYQINGNKKNSLTGGGANAINTMLVSYNPRQYIFVVSLNDRKRIIDFFGFPDGPNFENDSPGKKIYLSNKSILEGFSKLGIEASPRILTQFLYKGLKEHWKRDSNEEYEEITQNDWRPITKNLILYGPPGTGKTFNTKKISLEILGEVHD